MTNYSLLPNKIIALHVKLKSLAEKTNTGEISQQLIFNNAPHIFFLELLKVVMEIVII